jgi:hypothetical protein
MILSLGVKSYHHPIIIIIITIIITFIIIIILICFLLLFLIIILIANMSDKNQRHLPVLCAGHVLHNGYLHPRLRHTETPQQHVPIV